MKVPGDNETPPPDEKTRQRSAEQRNVTAPTPRDVREKAENKDEPQFPAGDNS